MKYYIEAYPAYHKEIEAKTLEEVLQYINARQLGKMEYHIFTGYPYTFENKVYQHLTNRG
jgi:hypothetical protein